MSAGIVAVRAELPVDASHVTDKQIQDALWHYYYDIEKSVGYLLSTYGAKSKVQKEKVKVQVQGRGGKKVQGGLFSVEGAVAGVGGYGDGDDGARDGASLEMIGGTVGGASIRYLWTYYFH